MAKQSQTVFLEEWLRSMTRGSGNIVSSRKPSLTSAQDIIQAWADLRDSVQQQSFNSHNLQSLHSLVTSQNSLYIADPQAKLLLSLLSSPKISLPQESYPLLLRLLYIWVRKSSRPSSLIVDYAVEVLLHLFSVRFHSDNVSAFYSECVLILGALSFVSSASEKSRKACHEMLCVLLEQEHKLIYMPEGLVFNVLAGIGYALSSSMNIYFIRILGILFGFWDKTDGPLASIENGLLVLHLTEWVISNFISSHSLDSINIFRKEILDNPPPTYASFVVVMAAAGVLRVINRTNSHLVMHLRIPAEEQIEAVAGHLILVTQDGKYSSVEPRNSFLLQCVSLAVSRCGAFSNRASLLFCLAEALLNEIFPLQCIYTSILESHAGNYVEVELNVQEHLESTIFKEAGAIAAVFCNHYVSSGKINQSSVENRMWDYCQYVYLGQRQVALKLQCVKEGLSVNLEKIAEAAFLMIVVFALTVTKQQKLGPGIAYEDHLKLSVHILVSFSCMEYFRRMRFQEYMDAIRAVITSVQENESACVSFVKSMPSYADLTSKPGSSISEEINYAWSTDEVQTARILFYLRVIPTCFECMPTSVFRMVVVPTMFLYMGHPTRKVARAAHSVFVAFISSGMDPNIDERVTLKEQLVFYYMKRSLEAYPGITPFEGVASGVTAIVRHLPAGSSSILYCIHSIAEKANSICCAIKDWEGESEPLKKLFELLLQLLYLVDIQVLPTLMKLLAQLIVQLPTDGQNMVLNDLYQQVAELDDVTRKPSMVSWVQSLSYLCTQDSSRRPSIEAAEMQTASIGDADTLSLNKINARL